MRSKGSTPSMARSAADSFDETGPLSPVKVDGDFVERYKLRDSDLSSNASNGWVLKGIDPTKAYRLAIMGSYMSKEDNGGVLYNKSNVIEEVVDKDEVFLVVIADLLRKEYKWGSKQYLRGLSWKTMWVNITQLRSSKQLTTMPYAQCSASLSGPGAIMDSSCNLLS